MKPTTKAAITTSAAVCATLFSLNWSEQSGVSLSVESAQARVGRPLTPLSGAGVARRQYRRAGYGGYGAYGAGLAGAAAVGTAAAIASGPGYYGGGPYSGYGYGAGGPYYGRGVLGARAAYYGASSASCATGEGCVGQSTPWTLVGAYYAGGPFYGYSGWADYKTRNGIGCDPGTPGCQ